DEIEQAGVGPMQVLEQQDDWSRCGDPLEERAPRAEQLLTCGAAATFEAEQDEERVFDPAPLGLIGDPARDAGRDRGPRRCLVVALDQPDPAADHLAEGPERDAFAVCRRPTGVPVDRVDEAVDVLGQLTRHAALADPGHAGDRHEAWTLVARRSEDEVTQQSALIVVTDERCFELVGPTAAAALGDDPDGTERR